MPIVSAISLVAIYYIIQNKWHTINMIFYGYIIFLGTLALKKYLYEYFKNSSNFAKYDYSINLPFRIFKVHLTLLELMTLLMFL